MTGIPSFARGIALISAMLLLLVMTVLSVAMFHSFGLQEKTAGNTREKQRALHAAEGAQTYAEWWLSASAGANATTGANCTAVTTVPQVCSNTLQDSATLPWAAAVSYTPPMLTVTAAGVADGYYAAPSFYVSFLANSYERTTGTQTRTYRVDAQGYAGTQKAVAVVESTYSVNLTYSTQTNGTKFISQSGP